MKKIFILLVGLFMSLGAVTFEELPVAGELDYSHGCGFKCDATAPAPLLTGRVWVDYIVFGENGKLTNDTGYMNRVRTVNFESSADTVVTIRPIALDDEAGSGQLDYVFGKNSDRWKLVQTDMKEQHTDSGGTSAANLMNGMSSAGMSNAATAGAGALLFFLSSNSPSGSFLYKITIKKDNKTDEMFIRIRNSRSSYALMQMSDYLTENR